MTRSRGTGVLFVIAAFVLGLWAATHVQVTFRGQDATAQPPPLQISPEEIYARAAAVAGPAVVNIDTESRVRVRSSWLDEEFFGPRYRRVANSGSGVIVSPDGDIITNDHVVGGADRITVSLSDGRKFSGRVIGSDYSTDVGLIKVDGQNLPVAKLGSSHGLIPGQLAVAIGNPLGLRFTVTHGIVSALGRPVKIGERIYENLIQTDCAINPGNSGGALVDREGKVIGINTLVMDSANGVGLAIPIDTAMRIAKDLKRYGKVKRPWTGIYAVPLTPSMARYFGLARAEGAFVERIVSGSPAHEAGIQPGDVVVELNGEAIRNDDDLRKATEKCKIGSRVSVKVLRGDQVAAGQIAIRESP